MKQRAAQLEEMHIKLLKVSSEAEKEALHPEAEQALASYEKEAEVARSLIASAKKRKQAANAEALYHTRSCAPSSCSCSLACWQVC